MHWPQSHRCLNIHRTSPTYNRLYLGFQQAYRHAVSCKTFVSTCPFARNQFRFANNRRHRAITHTNWQLRLPFTPLYYELGLETRSVRTRANQTNSTQFSHPKSIHKQQSYKRLKIARFRHTDSGLKLTNQRAASHSISNNLLHADWSISSRSQSSP